MWPLIVNISNNVLSLSSPNYTKNTIYLLCNVLYYWGITFNKYEINIGIIALLPTCIICNFYCYQNHEKLIQIFERPNNFCELDKEELEGRVIRLNLLYFSAWNWTFFDENKRIFYFIYFILETKKERSREKYTVCDWDVSLSINLAIFP